MAQGFPYSNRLHLALMSMLTVNLIVGNAFSSHVSVTQAEYPCPEGAPHYDVNAESTGFDNNTQAQCKQEWSIKTLTIAIYPPEEEMSCHEPCTMVQSGNLRLLRCVNVTLTTQCRRSGHLVESIIHFTGRVLQSPVVNSTVAPHQQGTRDGNHGFVVAVVVAVLLVVVLAVAGAGLVWKALKTKRTSPPSVV